VSAAAVKSVDARLRVGGPATAAGKWVDDLLVHCARIAELDQAERPLRITTKLVRQTIDDMNGILDHAPLATRVAWVRDLFERIDVDSRDEKAVAVWRAATDEGVNRSDSVYEWLWRRGTNLHPGG